MKLNVVSALVSKSRRHQFLVEYIKYNSSSNTIHIVDGLAGMAGHDFGKGLNAWISATKIMSDSVLKSVIKGVLFFPMLILLSGFSAEISPILGVVVFLLLSVYFFVPELLGM